MNVTRSVLIAAFGLAMQGAAYAQVQSGPQFYPGMETPPGNVIPPPTEPPADLSSGATDAMNSEAGADLRPAPAVSERPEPQTQNDVTYVCGGVGREETAYMKKAAKDYDMMLTFAARDGSYLADVDVEITDAKGLPVLHTTCSGPLMLVDLPKSGNYRVHAAAAGYTLNQTVKVTAGEKKGEHLAAAILSWPQQAIDTGGSRSTASGSGTTSGRAASGER
jgi:hypothetical protein